MNVSVSGQTLEFIYSGVLGISLGVAYDIFRLFRVHLRAGKILTGVFDVIYWLIAVVALLMFVLTVSGGQMRWYVLLGTFGGGFVYMCTVSHLFFRASDIIIKIVIRLLNVAVKPIYFLSGKALAVARRADKRIRNRVRKTRHEEDAAGQMQ